MFGPSSQERSIQSLEYAVLAWPTRRYRRSRIHGQFPAVPQAAGWRSSVARKVTGVRLSALNNEILLMRSPRGHRSTCIIAADYQRVYRRLVLDHYWTVNRGRLTGYLWRARMCGERRWSEPIVRACAASGARVYLDGSRAI